MLRSSAAWCPGCWLPPLSSPPPFPRSGRALMMMVSLAAAASGQMLTAVALLMTSELSRQTSLWFETFHVKFDK